MRWIILLICLLAGFLAAGCCVNRPLCQAEWHDDCSGGCDSCAAPALGCSSCSGAIGGPMRTGFGPLAYAHHAATCGAGCGRVYWGEWAASPPDCCDPCDSCGNFVGPQYGCRDWLYNWRNLWGVRFNDCSASCVSSCTSPGCTGCAGHGGNVIHEGSTMYEGEVIYEGQMIPAPSPRPTAAPRGAAPRQSREILTPPMPELPKETRSVLRSQRASHQVPIRGGSRTGRVEPLLLPPAR